MIYMPTRNFYVGLSRRFAPHQGLLKRALLVTWLGGFALLGVIILVFNSETAFLVLGKTWFTLCILLGIVYASTHWFNPRRDPLDSSPAESWTAVVINIVCALTVWIWFWRE